MPERALAPIAAVAHLLDHHRPDSQDAWAALGPWRMSGQSTITIHGDDWEQRVQAKQTKQGWQAIVDQTADTIRWSRDAAGVFTITGGDSVERYAVAERNESIEVTGNGGRWSMRPGPKPLNAVASQRRSSNGRVTAPLPATVMSVHVEAGDRVEAGQPLVTLFAMKMELVCEAPAGGTVESISIQARDLVAADQLLVVVRPIVPGDPDSG
jgi:acetyl/propionyl-CoA carboxylase alpha subunit